jgi:hypothetical protein
MNINGAELLQERDYLRKYPEDMMGQKIVREVDELEQKCLNVGIDLGDAEMVREDMLVEYTQHVAMDIGALGDRQPTDWPVRHIDWVAAAEDLRSDYRLMEFRGVTYLMRGY